MDRNVELMSALVSGTILHGSSYNYRIERVLGQGSFGITYLASVKMTGALGSIDANIYVAIKEFFMREINGREDSIVTMGSKQGIYLDYRKKFVREAQNLARLQHPNIIKVIESFEENNTVYYSMEYIDGGSLDSLINQKQGLPQEQVLEYLRQIGGALAFMHKSGMLHLDLKPSNIMLKGGKAVLIDFGLSKQYDSNGEPESSTRVGGGTPGYAPIEQANYKDRKEFPVTMDVYALGATMFKMLTGKRPPEASDILNDGFPETELENHQVESPLREILIKAMSPLRKNRYQSVDELLAACDGNSETTVVNVEIVSHNDVTSFDSRKENSVNELGYSVVDRIEEAEKGNKKKKTFGKYWMVGLVSVLVVFCICLYFLKDNKVSEPTATATQVAEEDTIQLSDTLLQRKKNKISQSSSPGGKIEDNSNNKVSNRKIQPSEDSPVSSSMIKDEVSKVSEEIKPQDENRIFDIVEVMPEFPGGEKALFQWLAENIKYPGICAEQGIQGRVYAQFVVDKDGSITDIKVVRSPDPYLSQEAIRVLANMPKWKPGMQRDKPVRVKFSIPIMFRLTQE